MLSNKSLFLLITLLIGVGLTGCNQSPEVVPPEPTQVPDSTATSEPIPSLTPESFNIVTESFDFEEWSRKYHVLIPDNYTDDEKIPLVIFLRAHGDTAESYMRYVRLNSVGNANQFMIVYPSCQSNWNSGIADHPDARTPNVDDVQFISILIDKLSDSYNIDLERVYVTGFGSGGFMVYKLACQLSERIAAIAVVDGTMSTSTLEECNPQHPMPVLHMHGTEDIWVPIEGENGWLSAEVTLDYWVGYNQCSQTDKTELPELDQTDGSSVEKIINSDCLDNSRVVYYEITGGGYTWPGAVEERGTGNINQDINAGEEIWDFFKEYQLPAQ